MDPNPEDSTALTTTNGETPRNRPKERKSKRTGRPRLPSIKKAYTHRVAQWFATRTANPNLSNREIAERIGVTYDTLMRCIAQARREGLLNFADPLDQLKYKVIPKAVDNLQELLDKKDKQATLETVKGTVFKTWQAQEVNQQITNLVLGIKIEMPDGQQSKVFTGQVVGIPKEAEVVEDETQS